MMNSTFSSIFMSDNYTLQLPTKEPYERPFNEAGIIASGIIIFFFLVIGLIFNTLTMLVIYKYKKLKDVFMCFIFSLCLSDLISSIISPLFWYRRTLGFDLWKLPDFFCKSFCHSSIGRAILQHPLQPLRFPQVFDKIGIRFAVIWILSIWFVSFTCGFIPFFIFFGARIRDRYSDSPDARWPACTINMEWYEMYTSYQKIAYPLFLYTPICCVIVISLVIVFTVIMRSKSTATTNMRKEALDKRIRKERQAVLQLVLIVFSFLLGYIPFTVYEFWSTQSHPNTRYYKLLDYWMGMIEYLFIRLSECLNPLFYNLGSSKMRRYTKRYLKEKLDSNAARERSVTMTTDEI